ncbi:unnamed protein product [Parnassius mnemosyne]|uniref:Reverse transcriptase domain-containing protein n=1 Tax=Parnassius mnemosyne TaxID=213953 RepID=A0AAV1LP86_9NEOP
MSSDVQRPVKAAVIVVDPTVQFFINPVTITNNIVACKFKIKSLNIVIINVYLEEGQQIEDDLCKISNYASILNEDHIILGGDINAKSPWWGCNVEDRRGAAVAETLSQLGLHILNTGNIPTFSVYRGERNYTSIVDVTACSSGLLRKISNWKVNPEFVTLSDHRALTFDLNNLSTVRINTERQSTRIYNTGKADWSNFIDTLKQKLTTFNITEETVNIIIDTDPLESLVRLYTTCVQESCEKTIPKLSRKVLRKTPWWTEELSTKKREVIQKRRKIRYANQRRKQIVIQEYILAKTEYKDLLTETMTTSWKNFCARQDKESVWQGIYRVIRKSGKAPEDTLLRTTSQSCILTPGESAQLLADTFYPTDEITTDEHDHVEMRNISVTIRKELCDKLHQDNLIPFTTTEIENVFNSMSPKKSPGEDGLTADICEKSYIAAPKVLIAIYNKCLSLGYFPQTWKGAVIKIIPKPNKENYTLPKSYRPIGLLPVFGKVLEKMFVNRMSWQLGRENKMSNRQYGFVAQRGTEDALYDAMEIIKKGIKDKEIVVIVSIDIEGAFDNAWWPAIIKELNNKNLDKTIQRLISSYLSERHIKLRYAGTEIIKETNKGCIQGSICGPLLWNLQLDSLLQEIEDLRIHIQAYADDIILIAKGKTAKDIETELNPALNCILNWSKNRKMKIAAHKTEAIITTKKTKYDIPKIVLGDAEIKYGQSDYIRTYN